MRCVALAAAVAAITCFSDAAQAAPVDYAGTLGSGSFAGSVAAESGPHGTPERWSFWRFTAPWLADVSITVTPTGTGFDPYIAVWYGTEADTADYVDMISGGLNSVFVAGADGLTEFGPNGVGDPAGLSFSNLYGSDSFVLAIADYVDGQGVGQLGYTINAAIPEPHTGALLLAGLTAVGAAARRRSA